MLLLNEAIEYPEQLQYKVRVRITKYGMCKIKVRVTKCRSIFKYVFDMQLISKYMKIIRYKYWYTNVVYNAVQICSQNGLFLNNSLRYI